MTVTRKGTETGLSSGRLVRIAPDLGHLCTGDKQEGYLVHRAPNSGRARGRAPIDRIHGRSSLPDSRLQRPSHDLFAVCGYVYQDVGAQCGMSTSQLFSGNDTPVSPAALATMLQHNPYFKEAGYMLPNER
jgi:hypothetical protein